MTELDPRVTGGGQLYGRLTRNRSVNKARVRKRGDGVNGWNALPYTNDPRYPRSCSRRAADDRPAGTHLFRLLDGIPHRRATRSSHIYTYRVPPQSPSDSPVTLTNPAHVSPPGITRTLRSDSVQVRCSEEMTRI